MNQIPTFDTASYSEEVTLDEAQYRLDFHYTFRGDYWVVDILDRDLNPLVMGVKVVPSYELLAQYKHLAVPQGILMAVDVAAENLRIGRDDLPTRVDLVYMTEAESAAL